MQTQIYLPFVEADLVDSRQTVEGMVNGSEYY